MKVALNSSARNIGSTVSVSPSLIKTDDSSELPLSKSVMLVKLKKALLLHFLDDIVIVDKLALCPAEKIRVGVRRYKDEDASLESPLQW